MVDGTKKTPKQLYADVIDALYEHSRDDSPESYLVVEDALDLFCQSLTGTARNVAYHAAEQLGFGASVESIEDTLDLIDDSDITG